MDAWLESLSWTQCGLGLALLWILTWIVIELLDAWLTRRPRNRRLPHRLPRPFFDERDSIARFRRMMARKGPV